MTAHTPASSAGMVRVGRRRRSRRVRRLGRWRRWRRRRQRRPGIRSRQRLARRHPSTAPAHSMRWLRCLRAWQSAGSSAYHWGWAQARSKPAPFCDFDGQRRPSCHAAVATPEPASLAVPGRGSRGPGRASRAPHVPAGTAGATLSVTPPQSRIELLRSRLSPSTFGEASCARSVPPCSPDPPCAVGVAACRSAARSRPQAAPSRRQPPATRRRPPALQCDPLVAGARPSTGRSYLQVYAAATAHVEREAASRAAGSWAVVLDADETVIDNSAYQLERERAGLPFDAPSWHEWTKRREALAQPGAHAFLARVRELGGRIAIVTNRTVSECPDTEAVFRARELASRRHAVQARRRARATRTRASRPWRAARRRRACRRSRSWPSSGTTSSTSRA